MIPEINLNNFDYELPEDRIAYFPKQERGFSKLLVAYNKNKNIIDNNFNNISDFLPSDSLLFINQTKVINARIRVQKPTGSFVELLLSKPLLPSTSNSIALTAKKEVTWECLIGGKLRIGEKLILDNINNLQAEIITKNGNICSIKFNWTTDFTFSELLSAIGNVPLPPYIKRKAELKDENRYQTVFAKVSGSVAAPTAGLHFTEKILNKIKTKNIQIEELTLHVGLGTFNPIKEDNIANHKMHNEAISISLEQVKTIHKAIGNKCITAVGTTSCRTLETLYVLGNKIKNKSFSPGENLANQWDYYNFENKLLPKESLEEVINYYEKNNITQIEGNTELLILPSYKFSIINNLITNFHAPKSTLILLVAAFCGEQFQKEIYEYALNNEYSFLSYGDSSILIND